MASCIDSAPSIVVRHPSDPDKVRYYGPFVGSTGAMAFAASQEWADQDWHWDLLRQLGDDD